MAYNLVNKVNNENETDMTSFQWQYEHFCDSSSKMALLLQIQQPESTVQKRFEFGSDYDCDEDEADDRHKRRRTMKYRMLIRQWVNAYRKQKPRPR